MSLNALEHREEVELWDDYKRHLENESFRLQLSEGKTFVWRTLTNMVQCMTTT